MFQLEREHANTWLPDEHLIEEILLSIKYFCPICKLDYPTRPFLLRELILYTASDNALRQKSSLVARDYYDFIWLYRQTPPNDHDCEITTGCCTRTYQAYLTIPQIMATASGYCKH